LIDNPDELVYKAYRHCWVGAFMLVSKKSRYALKAVFELSKRKRDEPVKIADIAKSQGIPQRFLEAILVQLKQAGFVESRRGSYGGYILSVDPAKLTVGDVLRTTQGLPQIVDCFAENPGEEGPMNANSIFNSIWEDMKKAITDIYDSTTFKCLIDKENQKCTESVLEYVI